LGRKGIWLRAILVLALFVAGFLAGSFLQDKVLDTNPEGPAGGVDHACPRSHGWWKNHTDGWTVDSLRLGAHGYTRTLLVEILGMATGGDASVILGRQLIAAKLNVASGSDDSAAADSISRADDLLDGFVGPLPYRIHASTAEGQAMVAVGAVLEDYNLGQLTPGCESGPGPDGPGGP